MYIFIIGNKTPTPTDDKGIEKSAAAVTDLNKSKDGGKHTPKTKGNTDHAPVLPNNKEVVPAISTAKAIKPKPNPLPKKKHVANSTAANDTIASRKATRSNVGNDGGGAGKAEKTAAKKNAPKKSAEGAGKAEKTAAKKNAPKKSGTGSGKAEKTLKLLHELKSNSENESKMIPLSEEQVDHWKKLFYNIHETIIKEAKGKPPEQRYEFISSSLRSNSFTDYTWGDDIIGLYSELGLKDVELKMLRLKRVSD